MDSILIAGASGFIGKYLVKRFTSAGWRVLTIGRNDAIKWSDAEALNKALNQSKVVINLAGKSVNCHHNVANRKEIIDSRVQTTTLINNAILHCENPPALWINASGNAIYPRSIKQQYNEFDATGDTTFMAEVCEKWEAAFYQNQLPNIRRVAFRTGVVLGKDGGILMQLSKLAKMGMGGTSGSGNQIMSWIHIEDYFRVIQFIFTNESITGPLNLCAPEPLSNKVFMQLLRKALKVNIGLPAPVFAVKLGAWCMGTEGSLALDSYNTVSKVLPENGFHFEFPTLNNAFKNLICD